MPFTEFSRSTLPDPVNLEDQVVLVLEPDGSRSLLLSDGRQWASLNGAVPLDALTGGTAGFIGQLGPGNFGVNAIRYPLNWDGVTTGAATRTGIAGQLAAAVLPGNWVRIFLGLAANGKGGAGTGPASGIFSSGTTIDAGRLAELQYAIAQCRGAGLKLLVALEDAVPGDATAMGLYRDRLIKLLGSLPLSTDLQATYIDAIEPSNEVYQQGATSARVAEMMRVTAKVFRAFSPNTIVLSPSYQGGEAMGGNLVLQMLAASAAGVAVLGDGGGMGTTGEQFCDAIAFHPYIETLQTMTAARAALASSAAQLRLREFVDPIRAAIANRRAANPGYWAGRADPEIWATEYNVNPNGGVAITNDAFRMQALTPGERSLLIEQMVQAAFACGCAKVFPYAVDHHYVLGPISGAAGAIASSIAPNGDVRVDCTGMTGNASILDGDLVFASDGGGWCYAYNGSANGKAADLRGMTFAWPYQVTVCRWQLGGWAEGYPGVQRKCFGCAETGWYGFGASAVPQLRIARGQVQRTVAGQLTTIGL